MKASHDVQEKWTYTTTYTKVLQAEAHAPIGIRTNPTHSDHSTTNSNQSKRRALAAQSLRRSYASRYLVRRCGTTSGALKDMNSEKEMNNMNDISDMRINTIKSYTILHKKNKYTITS